MDQPELELSAHAEALRGLGRINRLSRSASMLWPAIAGLAERHQGEPVRVLDLACGGGDIPIRLAARARRSGMDVRIDGCDISRTAVAFASEAANRVRVPVRLFRLDALNEPLPDGYNILMCSLFLHHLSEEDAVGLLRKIAGAARSLILVNDLLRSRLGYGLAQVACRLSSRSPIVHHDGPASVGAAFSLPEVRTLASRAGLDGARLERRWPRRFLLSWSPESR
jgi:SAM-dependent methyltransferase